MNNRHWPLQSLYYLQIEEPVDGPFHDVLRLPNVLPCGLRLLLAGEISLAKELKHCELPRFVADLPPNYVLQVLLEQPVRTLRQWPRLLRSPTLKL